MGACCSRSTDNNSVKVPDSNEGLNENQIVKEQIQMNSNNLTSTGGTNFLIDDNSVLITSQLNDNVTYNVKYKPRKNRDKQN